MCLNQVDLDEEINSSIKQYISETRIEYWQQPYYVCIKVGHMHGISTNQFFRPLWCYKKLKMEVIFNIRNPSERDLEPKKKLER